MTGWLDAALAVSALAADVLVVVATLAVAVGLGLPVTGGVLRLAGRSSDAGTAPPPDAPSSSLRGGTWIGVLERLAIAATLLAGYPSGIAVVVAVKGLGRYPELREHPDSSERFVIGTLASMLWACGAGLAGRALLT